MSDYTERFSEVHNPLDSDFSDSFAIGTHTSAYVSLANYHRALFYLNVGDIAAGGGIDAQLLQATSAAGAGAKAITGKSITRLTQAGGDSDSIVCIELRTEETDVGGGFEFVALEMTVISAAAEFAYTIFGRVSRYLPVPVTNWQEVVD